jgi:hypothetical protein
MMYDFTIKGTYLLAPGETFDYLLGKTDQPRITAYLHVLLLFASRSRFASEPAAPMFNRLAIQVKVIVACWSWSRNRSPYEFTIYDIRFTSGVVFGGCVEQSNVVGCSKAPSRGILSAQSMTI